MKRTKWTNSKTNLMKNNNFNSEMTSGHNYNARNWSQRERQYKNKIDPLHIKHWELKINNQQNKPAKQIQITKAETDHKVKNQVTEKKNILYQALRLTKMNSKGKKKKLETEINIDKMERTSKITAKVP